MYYFAMLILDIGLWTGICTAFVYQVSDTNLKSMHMVTFFSKEDSSGGKRSVFIVTAAYRQSKHEGDFSL